LKEAWRSGSERLAFHALKHLVGFRGPSERFERATEPDTHRRVVRQREGSLELGPRLHQSTGVVGLLAFGAELLDFLLGIRGPGEVRAERAQRPHHDRSAYPK
jgi:hypothetical protein